MGYVVAGMTGLHTRRAIASMQVELSSFESYPHERIVSYESASGEPSDASHCAVNHASKFTRVLSRTPFGEASFRFRGRKPGWISIEFLGFTQAQHLAQVGMDFLPLAIPQFSVLVLCECGLFDSAMHSRFFVGLDCRRLSIGEPRLNSAFGECPAVPARIHQKKFHAGAENTEAHCGNLLAFTGLNLPIRTSDKSWRFKAHGMRLHEFIHDD